MNTKTTTTMICVTKVAIVREIMQKSETGETLKTIADKYNVSSRTVSRCHEDLENGVLDHIDEQDVPTEAEEVIKTLTGNEKDKHADLVRQMEARNMADLAKAIDREATAANGDEFAKAGHSQGEKEDTSGRTRARRTSKPIERQDDGLTLNQRSILETYKRQKASGEMKKKEDRAGKVGRARKNVKTIRYITMEILENRANRGTLTDANKDAIIKEIMKKANTDEKTAKLYYSGHKALFKNTKKK